MILTPKTNPRRLPKRVRPITPRRAGQMPKTTGDEPPSADKPQRVPAGGGYRVLRRPRLLDGEE